MEFNRNIGKWDKDATELDNVVYQLYLDEIRNKSEDVCPGDQCVIMNIHSKFNIRAICDAYKIAEKILRIEKLIRLLELEKLNKNEN